jgi:hypothetical protein
MAKLRKMLGQADDPLIIQLMGLIETQSKTTLAQWALESVRRYLPIYEKAYPDDFRLEALMREAEAHLTGTLSLKELKSQLRAGREIPKSAENAPAAQAAARAIITACAVIQTPTNALGFVFYGAAAVAYDAAGLSADSETYDRLATAEFQALRDALQAISVPDEENPVRIDWHC